MIAALVTPSRPRGPPDGSGRVGPVPRTADRRPECRCHWRKNSPNRDTKFNAVVRSSARRPHRHTREVAIWQPRKLGAENRRPGVNSADLRGDRWRQPPVDASTGSDAPTRHAAFPCDAYEMPRIPRTICTRDAASASGSKDLALANGTGWVPRERRHSNLTPSGSPVADGGVARSFGLINSAGATTCRSANVSFRGVLQLPVGHSRLVPTPGISKAQRTGSRSEHAEPAAQADITCLRPRFTASSDGGSSSGTSVRVHFPSGSYTKACLSAGSTHTLRNFTGLP